MIGLKKQTYLMIVSRVPIFYNRFMNRIRQTRFAQNCRIKHRLIWVFVLITSLIIAITMGRIIHDYPAINPQTLSQVPLNQRVAVVLGAKAKNNVMSNTLRARVDYAIDLYRGQSVGQLIFTGGFRDKDPAHESSEAALARQYAIEKGVPAQHIWIEEVSTTTQENLQEAQKIVQTQDFKQILVVSDRWHLARAQMMARNLGMDVMPAPTPYSVYQSFSKKLGFIWRETWATWVYVLFGV